MLQKNQATEVLDAAVMEQATRGQMMSGGVANKASPQTLVLRVSALYPQLGLTVATLSTLC